MSSTSAPRPSALGTLAAWGVHALTASGAVVGLAALLATTGGELERAALLMLLALVIDSVDGTLARAARVAERVPSLDGRRLDDIVDYLNYVIVPAVFMVEAGSLVSPVVAAAPVLASAYGFAQVRAKTEDHFFLGFPSYWNVGAIYLWGFGAAPITGTAVILGFTALVFVPFKYAYLSHMPLLGRASAVISLIWVLVVALAIASPDALASLPLLELSLIFPAYYLAVSFWLGGLQRG